MKMNDYLYKEHILENNLFLKIKETNFDNENEWYYTFQDEIYKKNINILKFYE